MRTSIDLFCGAGGLTEGFRQAGFESVFATDIDETSVRTFRRNHPDAVVSCSPIESLDPQDIRDRLGLGLGELDVLVGGSPCQGFSINAPGRFLEDPRNSLFRDYVRFLKAFEPQTLVFENVPGMLSLADGAVFDQICEEFRKLGYEVSYRILYAPHYGVPQERFRLIVLGSRIGHAPFHPLPQFKAEGRANFTGGRSLVYRESDYPYDIASKPNTVYDALGDLPSIPSGGGADVMPYDREPHSQLACQLRDDSTQLHHHVCANLSKKNLERLAHIHPGGSWRDIPVELLPSGMKRARRSDHTKRYGRLRPDGLSSTIMTKVDPHWGAAFHFEQDRTLSVREAARLQTFPDKYIFEGSRSDQYRQIGNAVPVLLAHAIGQSLSDYLDGRTSRGRLLESACRYG